MVEKEVLRCKFCKLNQFRTVSGRCRRCDQSYSESLEDHTARIRLANLPPRPFYFKPTPPPGTITVCVRETSKNHGQNVRWTLRSDSSSFALVLGLLRWGQNLSEKVLAMKMGVPRTYISKLERTGTMPTLSSFARLCTALNVRPAVFINLMEIVESGKL